MNKRKDELADINKRTGRNMPQAIATGAILVIGVLGVLLASPHAFTYLILAFMLIAVWELKVDMTVAHITIPFLGLTVGSAYVLLATWYSPDHVMGFAVSFATALVLVILCACMLNLAGFSTPQIVAKQAKKAELDAMKKRGLDPDQPFDSPALHRTLMPLGLRNIVATVLSVLYIPLLAGFLILMLTQKQYQWRLFMAVFVPALSDTGGLIFGAAFGKHKLSPRISPKKSWEGLAGSALFAVIGTVAFYGFGFTADFLHFGWWKPIVLGLVLTIVGTLGDLSASMLKRDLGIKDMGFLLKGHGGVLDRVDSILLCAPFVYGALTLFGV